MAGHLCRSVLTQEDPWDERGDAAFSSKERPPGQVQRERLTNKVKKLFPAFEREVLSFSFVLGSPLLSKGPDVWNPWTCGSTPEGSLDFGQEREERSSRSHPFLVGGSGAW